MTHFGRFLDGVPWERLIPDAAHELVVSGLGELRGLDTCCSAHTDDRQIGIAYMPSPRRIGVNLAQLRAPEVDAKWFDPTSGEEHAAGAFSTSDRMQRFEPPHADHDWVLILASVP